nr:MAG TPA: ClpB protein [Caudoviricetes sp.]
MSDNIQKAKHNVGDHHPTQPWVWTEYKPGKFNWRVDKNAKPKDNADTGKQSTGGGATSLEEWAKRTTDDNLLKVVNNPKGNAQLRQIAYNELKSRNADLSQVDTSGTLATLLKMTTQQDPVAPTNAAAKVDINDGEGGNDDGEIVEDWFLNPDDPRIQKKFNKLQSRQDRIAYDRFVYAMKKKDPDYQPPVEVMYDLNRQYLEFLDNKEQRFMISAGGAGIGKSYGFKKIAELLNKRPFDAETDAPGDGDYDYVELGDINSKKQLLGVLKAHNGKILLFDDTDSVITRADLASIMKKATSASGKRVVGDPDDVKSNFVFTGRIIIMTNKDLVNLAKNEDTKAIISRATLTSEVYLTVDETIEVLKDRYEDMDVPQQPHLDDPEEDKQERKELFDLIVKNKNKIDPAKFTTRTFGTILSEKRSADRANKRAKQGGQWTNLIGSQQKEWERAAVRALTKGLAYEAIQPVETSDDISKAEALLSDAESLEKADFTEEQRENLAKKKEALPDGSFPIRNKSDLKNAIRLAGNAKNPERARRWIKRRAKSLGAEDMIPDTWKAQATDLGALPADDMSIEKAETLLFG